MATVVNSIADYNFGRVGISNKIYIGYEEFRQIDEIAGWAGYNTKEKTQGSETSSDIVQGKNNYIRTALEHNNSSNTTAYRANHYPFCFSSDTDITSIPSAQRYWPQLPRFDTDGTANDEGVLVGVQKYICPKSSSSVWGTDGDYYTLTETSSNSAYPIRPSNGIGAKLAYSPSKPYYARIRIPLNDLKWTNTENDTQYSILETGDETASAERLNGDLLIVTKVRGYINLINPNGTNGICDANGDYVFPHCINQIYYRVTTDEYGDSDDENTSEVPLITVLNSQAVGYTNTSLQNYNSESNFFGAGIPFEVPVLEGQKYLIFDIYTDICDSEAYQTDTSTVWWQMTWSFESCMFRRLTKSSATIPSYYIESNSELTPSLTYNYNGTTVTRQNASSYDVTENTGGDALSSITPTMCEYIWTVPHNLDTIHYIVSITEIGSRTTAGYRKEVQADILTQTSNIIQVRMKFPAGTYATDNSIPAGTFSIFLVGATGLNTDE